MKEQKLSRSQIFQVYKLKEQAFEEFYKQEHQELANEILQSIKEKEPTYEEAYAVLNLVHAKLQYESNFVHVLPTVKKWTLSRYQFLWLEYTNFYLKVQGYMHNQNIQHQNRKKIYFLKGTALDN